MSSQLIFGLQLLSFVAALVVFITMLLARSKENPKFLAGYGFILLGIFVMIVSLLIQIAVSARELFRITLLPAPALEMLATADSIALIPLMALCFLLGVLLVRDRFAA